MNTIKRKIVLGLLGLFMLFSTVSGQVESAASVEKSIWGIHLGIDPVSVHNEVRIKNQLALRSELGFGFEYSGGDWTGFPRLGIEPSFYYNLAKRASEKKDIAGNSANFLAVNTSLIYVTPLGSNSTKKEGIQVLVVPCWGARRNIGEHFNVEAAVGIGYMYEKMDYTDAVSWFGNKYSWTSEKHKPTFLVRFGIGYKFNFR